MLTLVVLPTLLLIACEMSHQSKRLTCETHTKAIEYVQTKRFVRAVIRCLSQVLPSPLKAISVFSDNKVELQSEL